MHVCKEHWKRLPTERNGQHRKQSSRFLAGDSTETSCSRWLSIRGKMRSVRVLAWGSFWGLPFHAKDCMGSCQCAELSWSLRKPSGSCRRDGNGVTLECLCMGRDQWGAQGMYLSFSRMSHATPVQFVALAAHRRKPTIARHVRVSQSPFKSNQRGTLLLFEYLWTKLLVLYVPTSGLFIHLLDVLYFCLLFEFSVVPQRIVTPTLCLSSVLHHKCHSFLSSGPSGESDF